MIALFGEIYLVNIFFQGQSGQYKTRPVLIINHDVDTNTCTIAEITSVPPNNPPKHYDAFKKEIHSIIECGLNCKSYVKCKNIHNVNEVKLLKKLGQMDGNEFIEMVDFILECI